MKISLLDIISVVIIIFCVTRGCKKGFVKSFFSFVAHIGSLIGAFVFCKPLGVYISEKYLQGFLEEKLTFLDSAEKILKITEGIDFKTSEILGKIIAFVLIYIAICLACFILSKLFGPVFKLPILKQFNGLLGGAISFFKALFIIFILFTAITALEPFLAETAIYKSGLLNTQNAYIFEFMNEKIIGGLINYLNV